MIMKCTLLAVVRCLSGLVLVLTSQASEVKCGLYADNVLFSVDVDGKRVYQSSGSSESTGSHDGGVLWLTFDSAATTMSVTVRDWEAGCGNGGLNVRCEGESPRWATVDCWSCGFEGQASDAHCQ